MDRSKLKIVSPCSEDFDQMEGEGFRRFCDKCEKHVHNLSDLTRSEALELIRNNERSEMCVVYTFDASNRVRFRDDLGFRRPPKAQLRGIKKLLAAAAVVPMLAGLPACDTSPPQPEQMLVGYRTAGEHDSADFRPIDELLEAERRFTQRIKELLGFVPEYEMVAGEPMIDPDFYEEPVPVPMPPEPPVMGALVAPDLEPLIEPEPEPAPEIGQRKLMGDLAIAPELLEDVD